MNGFTSERGVNKRGGGGKINGLSVRSPTGTDRPLKHESSQIARTGCQMTVKGFVCKFYVA